MRHCRNEDAKPNLQPITEPSARVQELGTGRLLDGLLRGARSVLSQVRAAPGQGGDPLLCLDEHLLSDIGIRADAIRRDPPRHAWPH